MNLRSLFTAGALVSMGVLVSRMLGLVREMLLAGRYGAGPTADMAVALLVIPDFVVSSLSGAAVSATLVPLFTSRSREDAAKLMWQALAVSLGVFTLLAIVIACNAGSIAAHVGHDADIQAMAVRAFVIAIMSIPLTAASAIITAWQQHQGRFSVPAFANAIFNGVLVIMLWLMPVGLTMLAIAIFCGVAARLGANAFSFYRSGGRMQRGSLKPWLITGTIAKNYLTTMATDICNLMPQFAPYYLVALAGAGVAIFNYGFRLSVMPAMIGYNVIQMVFLPWFSRLLRDADGSKIPHYSLTLQCAWALSLACSLPLMLASREIAQLCFGYGKMSEDGLAEIGRLFAIGVWSMAPVILTGVWQQLLYAHGKPRMPLLASIAQAVIILPLSWVGNKVMGLSGVMLSYTLLWVISVALLSWEGYKQEIIARWRPSPVYAVMLLRCVAVWLPLAWLYRSVAWGLAGKTALTAVIGAMVLAAALSACAPVRQWVQHKVKKHD